jgi:hypothetical protein
MIEAFQMLNAKGFDGFWFAEQCKLQYSSVEDLIRNALAAVSKGNNLVTFGGAGETVPVTDKVFSGVHPVMWAELIVLVLVSILVSLIVFNRPSGVLSKTDYSVGMFVAAFLFLFDQA